ncbi:MAG TPA: alpha/beta hydrolase, partial [Pseudonocardiaceae bacterium]|nr:alpha/beta hydrolase [Pseudonocardiaceae bacterium]
MAGTQTLVQRIPAQWQAAVVRALFQLPRPVRRLIAGPQIIRDGQRLDLDLQMLLRLSRIEGNAELGGGTTEAARARLEAGSLLIAGPRIEPVSTRPIGIPTADRTIPARLYTPTGLAAGSPLLIFYHGGGWVVGSLESHDNLCRYLAQQAGVRVLSVDYRMAPEHAFPAAVDDALAAFGYAAGNAEDLGIDPAAIAVGGDSAGGNLAAVVAHTAGLNGTARPVFALLLYPATDGTTRRPSREKFGEGFMLTDANMTWFMDHYVPDVEQRSDPRMSVLLADDLRGFPATYLATAGFDPLRDEGEAFAEKLAAAGVRVVARRHPDLIHGYASMLAAGSRCREAVAEAAGALRVGLALSRPKPRARRKPAATKSDA